jgi:ribonuclease BN (tRNA processing enzyme)
MEVSNHMKRSLSVRTLTKATVSGLSAVLVIGAGCSLFSQTMEPTALGTSAIVLGVGTPVLDENRAGTSIGIVASGTLYLFDAGAGVERRIMEAHEKLAAFHVRKLGPVFISHYHMDHMLGLAALLYYHDIGADSRLGLSFGGGSQTPAMVTKLSVFGPRPVAGNLGIREAMDQLQTMFPLLANGEPIAKMPVDAVEIAPGVVYQDANVTVTAFDVTHKTKIAYGFRIQTADRVIVISGDTSPVDSIVEACNGCDLLFHEGGEATAGAGHTSARELGEIAGRARAKHVVIYHHMGSPRPDLVGEKFKGKVTAARDLDVF